MIDASGVDDGTTAESEALLDGESVGVERTTELPPSVGVEDGRGDEETASNDASGAGVDDEADADDPSVGAEDDADGVA